MPDKVLVLGAGIQGVACALALSYKGYKVTLIDQFHEPLSQTSVRGEAKVHLGYVYANDPSFKTASLMLKSAMHFAPLLDAWTNKAIDWPQLYSNPFTYVVHQDSMVPVDSLQQHYDRIANDYQLYRQQGLHYLGHRPAELLARPQKISSLFNAAFVRATITTPELALQTDRLKPMLLAALQEKPIQFCPDRRVQSINRTSAGFRVAGHTTCGDAWFEEGSIVVNCLWDGRLQLDASLGIHPKQTWVYRLKHSLLGHLPPQLTKLASYTIVLGPFGDVVTYPNGLTYLSWYPTCLRGWSSQLQPPAHWPVNPSENGVVAAIKAEGWQQQSLSALNTLIPGLEQFTIVQANAGVIFSWGETDIDDPHSLLHYRYNIGVNGFDGYYSIDTGKFTSAPLFAQALLDQLG